MRDFPSRFPHLAAWMDSAHPDHPLHAYVAAFSTSETDGSVSESFLAAFDSMIGTLESAKPERLATERSDFRKAGTFDDFKSVHAELVLAAKLARAGVEFDFGRRNGRTEPDLMLRGLDLGVEIKARRLDGLADLREELQDALAASGAKVRAVLGYDYRPLWIRAGERAAIVEQTVARAQAGPAGTAVTVLERPWTPTGKVELTVELFPDEPVPGGSRVVVGESGFELTGHLGEIEHDVLQVLGDEQKMRQARQLPTLLIIDASRLGVAWMRPPEIWAGQLASGLAQFPDTPVVGVGVMIPVLNSTEIDIAVTLRETAPDKDVRAAGQFLTSIGLSAR